MWIFSQKAFLSIVRHTDKPNILIVRSRFRGHIERIFPKARVEEDVERDYRFRTELLPRLKVSLVPSNSIDPMSPVGFPFFKTPPTSNPFPSS